jgi:hypothetical protein
MALPKKIKKDVNIKASTPFDGPINWVDQFLDQNKQFLPRDVDLTDLDQGFVDFIKNDLNIVIDGEKLPNIFLTLQRWNEFTQLWQNSDKYKNIKIPFISIVRRPNPEVGSNPADYKIPVRKTFAYAKIPTWDANRNGMDIYSIPNPVGVDMIYTVRFFSYKMRDVNFVHKKILQTFASAQAYMNVKGHYFPILLESIGDESQIDDLDTKRFYVQTYEIKVQGYIVDSEEFEIKPAISRMFVSTEIGDKKLKPIYRELKTGNNIRYIIQYLPGTTTNMSIVVNNNVIIENIITTNVLEYTLYLNGQLVTIPFNANIGDQIDVNIVRIDSNSFSEVELFGVKI